MCTLNLVSVVLLVTLSGAKHDFAIIRGLMIRKPQMTIQRCLHVFGNFMLRGHCLLFGDRIYLLRKNKDEATNSVTPAKGMSKGKMAIN